MFIHKMREKLFKRIFDIWARIGFESIMSLSGTITLLITRRSLVYIYSTYIVYIYIVYSILSPKLELSLKAETKANSNSALSTFLHSLVTTFPTLCTSQPSYSPTAISMTTISSQWSNNIYCCQHDHSSPAHQLQLSMQLLFHYLADPILGSTTF